MERKDSFVSQIKYAGGVLFYCLRILRLQAYFFSNLIYSSCMQFPFLKLIEEKIQKTEEKKGS